MTRRRARSVALISLIMALMTPPVAAQDLDPERLQAVADSMAHDQIATGRTPGVTLAVARNGEVVFARGYGRADVEMGVAASPETVYRIGSITKQFTAAAIMRLAEAGSLSLDDPITEYLPDYPVRDRRVTIRHLLNHTSGIPSYTGLDRGHWERDFRLDLSDQELIDMFDELPFEFEPGADYAYNNSAYYLLGVVVGEVTGVPYAEYVERELFAPLGLENTVYCDVRRVIAERAEGYEYDDGELVNAPYLSMRIPGAAGALCSTVGDLVRWTHLLHGEDVVSEASFRAMTTPTALSTGDTAAYGFGLGIGEVDGRRKIAHGGGIHGFSAYLSHYPDAGLTIAVLTNAGSGQPGRVEEALARTAFGMDLVAVKDLPVTAAEIARYEGTYRLQVGPNTLDLRVFGRDGRLMSQATGQPETRLRHQGGHVFIPTFDDNVRLVFTVEDGRATRVTLHQGGGVFPGERQR